MTEIRTTSSTGGQKGVKPERHSLLPRKGIAAIARVFGFGAQKYADHNWRRRYEWSKSIDANDRHWGAFVDGETYDLCPDGCEFLSETGDRTCRNHSGLPHLAHCGFHILVLLTWLEEDGEGVDNIFDDRWPAAMERMRLAEEPEYDYHTIAQEILDRRAGKGDDQPLKVEVHVEPPVARGGIVEGLQRSFERRGQHFPAAQTRLNLSDI